MKTITNKQIIRSEKRKNNSVTISNSIITDKNLKPLDKMVLIYILSEPNDAVLYQRSIAKSLGVTLGTVIKTFKNLETFGYMERDKFNGGVDNYIIYELGYLNNAQVSNTDAEIEQPTIDSLNRVKKLVKKKITYSATGLKNVVKDTIGMLKIESKIPEEKFSLDNVLFELLKKHDTPTKLKIMNVMSKMSHEINLSDFSFSKNKLRESLIWLNANQSQIKLSEDEISDIQYEIEIFIQKLD